MIARIKNLEPLNDYKLYVVFDDGKSVIYDMTEDMNTARNAKQHKPNASGKSRTH